MTLEEMKKLRKEKGFTYRQISEGSGVALGTVQKIFGKTTTSPRYDTMKKLDSYFVSESAHFGVDGAKRKRRSKARKGDDDRQGHYTTDDYFSWPDEERVELIDGVIYDMAAPTYAHQMFQGEIFAQLREQIRKNGGGCLPMIAPADVKLDGADDDRTMVQPDIFIVCDRKKVTMERTVGCPDFIIEILSPSSRKKDTFIKQNKYRSAGVREYWTVDLRDELVTTYLYDEARVLQYSLEDRVPIGIYNGKIKVDFAEITAYVRDYLGDYRVGEMDPEEPEDDERA